MMSTGMMIFLIVCYSFIVLAALTEGNWMRALYFGGAIMISFSVLGMSK